MVNFCTRTLENAVLAQPERDFVGRLLQIELTRFVQGSLYKKNVTGAMMFSEWIDSSLCAFE